MTKVLYFKNVSNFPLFVSVLKFDVPLEFSKKVFLTLDKQLRELLQTM